MKKLQKFLIMAVCLCTLAGVTAPAASAAATVVQEAHITLTEPEAGKTPASTAQVPPGLGYCVKKVEWEGALEGGKFKADTAYTANVTLGIEEDAKAKFADDVFDAYVNDYLIDEVIWISDTELMVPVEFEKTGAAADNPPANPGAAGGSVTVSKVEVTIAEPQVGEALPTEAKVSSPAGAIVTKVRWTGDLDSGMPKPGGKGSATITIEAQPGSGITFAGWDAMEVTVNGQKTSMLTDKEMRLDVIANFTFPAAMTPAGNGAVGGFSDVTEKDYFAQPVLWAVEKKITSGTGNGRFSPDQTCTQAQILTFLWRAAGSPEPKGTVEMEGFDGTEYYYKAAAWAAEQDMVGGDFAPDASCTRAMAVTYMWKQAGSPATPAASFTDVPAGADYAQAVAWAVEQGVTSGAGNDQFSPAQTCTRGQIVTFLYRADQNK